MKKILLVDDSALMRRVLCDIIESDGRYQVADRAMNGQAALDLLLKNRYDAVVLDVNMPVMDGIQLLKELHKRRLSFNIMMASTDTMEGAKVTLDALDLGALDFIHKPANASDCKEESFKKHFLRVLEGVIISKPPVFGAEKAFSMDDYKSTKKVLDVVAKTASKIKGRKLVAIACSTGGPKALQSVIPKLPGNLNAPVMLVQHMPQGFTKSLAERLNSLSDIKVTEGQEGESLEKGHVYIAMGGKHMNYAKGAGKGVIHYSDEPTREGVKPCANYMYESLRFSDYDEIVCVVLTGMGADGTEGIGRLKKSKKIHVITQEKGSCTVYGMPKAAEMAGLSDQVVSLDHIAQEIIMNVGIG